LFLFIFAIEFIPSSQHIHAFDLILHSRFTSPAVTQPPYNKNSEGRRSHLRLNISQ
jgi:hypothetical protein